MRGGEYQCKFSKLLFLIKEVSHSSILRSRGAKDKKCQNSVLKGTKKTAIYLFLLISIFLCIISISISLCTHKYAYTYI